ncbi:ankyrin repeat-containing protein [Tanacetum coccineum]
MVRAADLELEFNQYQENTNARLTTLENELAAMRLELTNCHEELKHLEQIQVPELCLEGEALSWYCWSEGRSPFRSWEGLKRRLLNRFQQTQQGNLFEQFLTITQDGTARAYVALFEKLAGQLHSVRVMHPEGLNHAMILAVTIEENKGFDIGARGGGSYRSGGTTSNFSGYKNNTTSSTRTLLSTASTGNKGGISSTGRVLLVDEEEEYEEEDGEELKMATDHVHLDMVEIIVWDREKAILDHANLNGIVAAAGFFKCKKKVVEKLVWDNGNLLRDDLRLQQQDLSLQQERIKETIHAIENTHNTLREYNNSLDLQRSFLNKMVLIRTLGLEESAIRLDIPKLELTEQLSEFIKSTELRVKNLQSLLGDKRIIHQDIIVPQKHEFYYIHNVINSIGAESMIQDAAKASFIEESELIKSIKVSINKFIMNVMAVHLDMFCPFMKNWIARHRDEHGSGTDGTGNESDGSENRIFQKSRNREPNQEQKNLKLKKRNRNRRFWFGSVLLGPVRSLF